MNPCIVYVTFDTREAAEVTVAQLVKERLAAGVNYFPVRSILWSDKTLEDGGEWVAILHTRSSLWHDLKLRIHQLHSRAIPCVIKLDVETTRSFDQWTIDTTQKPGAVD